MIHKNYKNKDDNEFWGTIFIIFGFGLMCGGSPIGIFLFILGCLII